MYHYAGNNPVRYTDPDGREDIEHPSVPVYTMTAGNWIENSRKTKNPTKLDGKVKEYTNTEKLFLFDLIRNATKQEPLDIINKFNSTHPDTPIDENILCELFADPDRSKALLIERVELHKDLRYQLNEKAPINLNAAKLQMKKLPWYKSIYHNPLENEKYVSRNGHMEGVYNKNTGLPDNDKKYMATFNFFSPSNASAHLKTDVDPYNKWGN